jgi:hypothetical protein
MAAQSRKAQKAIAERCKNFIGAPSICCAVTLILVRYSLSERGGFLQKRIGRIF